MMLRSLVSFLNRRGPALPASAAAALLLVGCVSTGSTVGIGAEIEQQSAAIATRLGEIQTRLSAEIVGVKAQVTNEIWPWMVGVMVVAACGTIILVAWIRHNSYAKQKPKWEAQRRA